MAAAAARVDQFYGVLGTTRSALFPQVGADLAGSRTRASGQTISPAPATNPYNAVQASLLASWEIDLFGRTRRLTEAATAELQASEAARRGTVLSVVAAVTAGYVRLRDLDREVEVARDTLGLRKDSLTLFERRFRGGVVSEVEAEPGALRIRHGACARCRSWSSRRRSRRTRCRCWWGATPGRSRAAGRSTNWRCRRCRPACRRT